MVYLINMFSVYVHWLIYFVKYPAPSAITQVSVTKCRCNTSKLKSVIKTLFSKPVKGIFVSHSRKEQHGTFTTLQIEFRKYPMYQRLPSYVQNYYNPCS